MSKLSTIIAAAMLLAACKPSPQDQAERIVKSYLLDPESARFIDWHTGAGGVLCGRVMSRNGFGGMGQPLAFVADPVLGEAIIQRPAKGESWLERAISANTLEKYGCSIGPDHEKALGLREAFDFAPEITWSKPKL